MDTLSNRNAVSTSTRPIGKWKWKIRFQMLPQFSMWKEVEERACTENHSIAPGW